MGSVFLVLSHSFESKSINISSVVIQLNIGMNDEC